MGKMIKWAMETLKVPELRLLESYEYHRLNELRGAGLPDNDEWIPRPEFGKVIIAELQGEIVGFWVIQQMIHVDPVWVKPDLRGNLTWRMWNAVRKIVGHTPVYVSVAPNYSGWQKTVSTIKHLGFEFLGQLYVRKGD